MTPITRRECFSKDVLKLDCEQETEALVAFLRERARAFRRGGAVVGISGGIDSSVTAALCARAFGPQKVLGIAMPEKESSSESAPLARELAERLKIAFLVEDLTPVLEAAGCYRKRDEVIRELVPEYAAGWSCKIVLPPNLLEKGGLNVFSVVAGSPAGESIARRLPPRHYLQIVAASNFKQRARMMTLYYHAEKQNYLVAGTGNKNEHDLGFFVKYGDGGADVKPLARYFKTQIFQLGAYLGVPPGILERTPTTDTYSAEVTQEEFFFRIDFETLDLIWHALEHGVPRERAAEALGLTPEQIERVQSDILQKKRATEYLRAEPAAY